jgi:hypothetical protein
VTEEQDLLSGVALTLFRLNGQLLGVAEELARPVGLTAERAEMGDPQAFVRHGLDDFALVLELLAGVLATPGDAAARPKVRLDRRSEEVALHLGRIGDGAPHLVRGSADVDRCGRNAIRHLR